MYYPQHAQTASPTFVAFFSRGTSMDAGLSDHGLLADSEAILVLAVDGRCHVLRDGQSMSVMWGVCSV
jgi:hypothetical protein